MNNFSTTILLISLSYLFSGCNRAPESKNTIDRFALVNRHNVHIKEFDPLGSLSVGNGRFAFTVDATGLQTFPELYKDGVCLGTQSEWGWHSFPDTAGYNLNETYQWFDVEGRKVPYAVQWREPARKRDASNYFRMNPHRLHLADVGFHLRKSDKSTAIPEDITEVNQFLDLWKGLIVSSFNVEGEEVGVQTCCHPERDMIGVEISSSQLTKGLVGLQIRFPYPTAGHVDDAANRLRMEGHTSEIAEQKGNSVIFRHQIDEAVTWVKVAWSGVAGVEFADEHRFLVLPEGGESTVSFSVEFSPDNDFRELVTFEDIRDLSVIQWEKFWLAGGAVDFSGTTDPRAFELERRVVLSQYLTRIQCAGSQPPQETGLTFNSWYGKPHLEMHWWHGVHWTYWNRTEILENSVPYYFTIFPRAADKASLQGYKGVRWPKMTDPDGNDSPSGVGEFLIWQQPHPIYYAELLYHNNPEKETLDKYAPLVFSSAEFMADFARWDETGKRFILGPPLIPAQESLEKEKTVNPPFELAYWHWGLSKAVEWKKRMNQPVPEEWTRVITGLSGFAHKDGLYLAAESAPDSYENEHYYSDHPMVLGAFGIMPGMPGLDTAMMSATFDHIEKIWNWNRTWGWDYPMAAMAATRLGKPEKAIDLLMKDVQKNTYLINGHNYQDNRLRIYLPGNGGLLTAVAMMCAGFEGNDKNNPGFPDSWKVRWENLKPVF